ncbi:MAG: heme lyase CcmF/NrfE family subunit [Cardiobacteriaceae bacterium]|nr:heme lyase CcmF/NrfE family subunit [Cardiobacteriaceae bacterium]
MNLTLLLLELGHFSLIVAGIVALNQTLLGLLYPHHQRMHGLQIRSSYAVFSLLLLSFLALMWGFYANAFSVRYIAAHSNSLLPWYYRLAATWGGHEGSLLLWLLILSAWGAALAWKTPSLPSDYRAKVLTILAYIELGFVLFIVLSSNPFQTLYPAPFDGADLNPLLQDPGLIFHPPLLYTGYVGFALAFAFVVAGLWQGQLNPLWLRIIRPWTLAAWLALTLGIALGSYWAYYELGWGGWWFWDPVENASLMPWLIGVALIHTLIASARRGLFLIWSALLAILAFILSLIGTFLVRSGVLTSVHAFASDPTRGIFILALILAIVLPALTLLVLRAHRLHSNAEFGLLSRETGLLLNNWIFFGACFIVFIGTLYPLVADLLKLGKISVGAPYFNRFIVPLAELSLVMLMVAPLLRWKQDKAKRLIPRLMIVLTFSFISTYAILETADAWSLGSYVAVQTAMMAFYTIIIDHLDKGKALFAHARRELATSTAHLGYIIMCLGITATGFYSQEYDLSIRIGQSVEVVHYRLTLNDLHQEQGTNFQATVGQFTVEHQHKPNWFTVLSPAKRTYFSSTMPMTESAILSTPRHDLYVALGEPINAQTWAIRVQYKPFVVWIWLGGLLMALGAWFGILLLRQRQQSALPTTPSLSLE